MKRSSILLAASFATVLSTGLTMGLANASGPGECPRMKGGMPIEEIDTDKNGTLSAAEIKAYQKKHFDEADLNHDGSLDPNEFKQMHEKEMARREELMFKHMDANGDGKVSADELDKMRGMHLQACDKDKNGDISKDEMANCHTMMNHENMEKHMGMMNDKHADMNKMMQDMAKPTPGGKPASTPPAKQ